MSNNNLAYRDPKGAEYVREKSGNQERILKIEQPQKTPLLLALLRKLFRLGKR